LLERLCRTLKTDYSMLFNFDNKLSREDILENISSTAKNLDDKKLKYLYKMTQELCNF